VPGGEAADHVAVAMKPSSTSVAAARLDELPWLQSRAMLVEADRVWVAPAVRAGV
jgi:hypothetical protein